MYVLIDRKWRWRDMDLWWEDWRRGGRDGTGGYGWRIVGVDGRFGGGIGWKGRGVEGKGSGREG